LDRWEWDRKSIKEYREKHEPYNSFEEMMLDGFRDSNKFSALSLESWKGRFAEKSSCWICKKGTISGSETVLPSGLIVLNRQCSAPSCLFFESLLLTPEDEALDFTHEPEEETPIVRKLSKESIERAKESIEKANKFMRKIRKKRR